MDLTLVGAKFRPAEARECLASLVEGDQVELRREPDNRFDPNAIQIWCEYHFIGYVAKHEAAVIAPDMDEDGSEYFEATISARPSRLSAVLSYDGPGSDQ